MSVGSRVARIRPRNMLLNAMTESINQEYCADGIRACAICPGEVATEILDARPVPVSTEDRSRMVQAEDLGDLILHVCRTPPMSA